MNVILWTAVIALSVVLDQITKAWAVNALMGQGTWNVLPPLLDFVYVENTGAAFGMMQGKRWIFLTVSTLAILAIAVFLWMKRKTVPRWLGLSLAMIAGGGIGNQIDRFCNGYVVDFIEFSFFHIGSFSFPVFNVADCFVTVGAFLLVICYALEEGKTEKQKKADKAASAGDLSE